MMTDFERFLNRLRILRSLDVDEVPDVSNWRRFQGNPYEYFISCSYADGDHLWWALRKREEGDA